MKFPKYSPMFLLLPGLERVNKDLPGTDHQVSLEPEELKAMVWSIQEVEAALGSGHKHPVQAEKPGDRPQKPGGGQTYPKRGAFFREEHDRKMSGQQNLSSVLLGMAGQGSC